LWRRPRPKLGYGAKERRRRRKEDGYPMPNGLKKTICLNAIAFEVCFSKLSKCLCLVTRMQDKII
jgi:hypothetical protein